ncbi:hypothetical protein ACFSJ3_15190 [Corallincola platygyrae]|uniref:Uncharacterized protein n=1 Tax=Corallincola platygyrae TaxID=1193278 RepID=A0ABW4XP66_9GAMM
MKSQRGIAMIEYMLVFAALLVTLLTPLDDNYMPSQNGRNIIERLNDAIRQNQTAYEEATSIGVLR